MSPEQTAAIQGCGSQQACGVGIAQNQGIRLGGASGSDWRATGRSPSAPPTKKQASQSLARLPYTV